MLTFGVTVFADYLRMLRACCDLTGREDLYKLNGTDVEGRIQKIVVDCAQLKGEEGPTPCSSSPIPAASASRPRPPSPAPSWPTWVPATSRP